MLKVLVVDDNEDIRYLLCDLLEDEGYKVLQAGSLQDAQSIITSTDLDVAILDIWLEGRQMDGVLLLKQLKRLHVDLPIIMISGHAGVETAALAIKLGAYDFIEKPFKSEKILLTIRHAAKAGLAASTRRREFERKACDALVGSRGFVAAIRKEVDNVARSKAWVLVRGAKGTGKSMVAEMIHQMSQRAGKLVQVQVDGSNCSEIGRILLGGGHSQDRGLVHTALGGTVLLLHADRIPPRVQAEIVQGMHKLDAARRDDACDNSEEMPRLIGTSCSGMFSGGGVAQNIGAGSGVAELISRLAIRTVELPSLQGRAEDIAALVHHFSELSAAAYAIDPIKIADTAMNALVTHTWPGNVSELKLYIEYWSLLSWRGLLDQVELEHLPQQSVTAQQESSTDLQEAIAQHLYYRDYKSAKHEFDKAYFAKHLASFGGAVSKLSDFSGIERTALYRKLRSLGLK